MSDLDPSLTVVVTRTIKPGCEEAFEQAMKEFMDVAWTFPGHLGMQMLKPAEADQFGEYTVLARFDSLESRRIFTSSSLFQEWMDRLAKHSIGHPTVRELNGIEGWLFADKIGNPPKWKMALTVWISVFILSQICDFLLRPLVREWPQPLQALLGIGIVVAVITWLILPPVTHALRGWYFR